MQSSQPLTLSMVSLCQRCAESFNRKPRRHRSLADWKPDPFLDVRRGGTIASELMLIRSLTIISYSQSRFVDISGDRRLIQLFDCAARHVQERWTGQRTSLSISTLPRMAVLDVSRKATSGSNGLTLAAAMAASSALWLLCTLRFL